FAELAQHEAWALDVPEEATPEPATPVQDERSATPPPLLRILEAVLFVGGEPLTSERASAAIRGLTAPQMSDAVGVLN
ncbi:hypothetical protein, partial [Klebsiella pneumoniae]|uniref:hypothetical protein n=1 Tax=Klebsiella pneumoniae TaxID=573 RepID=UPI00301359D5